MADLTIKMPTTEADALAGMLGMPIGQGQAAPPPNMAPPDPSQSGGALPPIPQLADAPAPTGFGEPGSSTYQQAKLDQDTNRKQPGLLGKIGGYAASILTPNVAAMIPQTPLGRIAQLSQDRNQLAQSQANERAQGQEASEEKLRGAQSEHAQAETQALEHPPTKPIQPADVIKAREKGFMYDADGNLTPVTRDMMTPEEVANEDLKKATAEYRRAQGDLAEAKADPNSPQYRLAQARLDVAKQNAATAAQRLGLSSDMFQNKIQEQGLIKPSGQAQSRGSAAQAALDVMPGLATLVHKNADSMGPLMGRLYRGEVAIGDVPPDIAQLYGALKSFYALQPGVHGFRNANFVKDFESAIGTLERDPEAFLAGMQGLKPTMEAIAKEGKTYSKRLIEGQGSSTAPERPKGVPSDAKWNADTRTWTK